MFSRDRLGRFDPWKQALLKFTNHRDISGTLQEVLRGTDVFVGVSKGNLLIADDVRSMPMPHRSPQR